MNPYEEIRQSLRGFGSTFENAAVDAVLSLMADSYPGDMDPSDRAYDYVHRHIVARFGHEHPVLRSLYKLRSERAGL